MDRQHKVTLEHGLVREILGSAVNHFTIPALLMAKASD